MYLLLAFWGYVTIRRKKMYYSKLEESIFSISPESVPPISIVAPAYNEEVIIIDNAESLLSLDYPDFEVVIVNDGSKDKTLELLIDRFELEEIEFNYNYKVACEPVKRIYKSTNSEYSKLTVLDKVNGGTKADAMNAGVNYVKNDYFINTDVDCILARDTLKKVIMPVLDSNVAVIAVGATMRMSNSCDVEHGVMTRVRPPKRFIPTFQETEYLRSYLLAKMGWSAINAVPNVSGGFGLFNTSVVINAGGFDSSSHAEDMDMTLRIAAYMRERNLKYKIEQIPDSCCWTEGPPNIKVLKRQRARWGRGLMQIFFVHRRFLFNREYGRMGLLILPVSLFFELLAPIIEITGMIFMTYLFLTEQVNIQTFGLMLLYVYMISLTVSSITILYDLRVKKQYRTLSEYLRLLFFSSLEPFLYHPLVVLFTLRGYVEFFTKRNFKWGAMSRQGFKKKNATFSSK